MSLFPYDEKVAIGSKQFETAEVMHKLAPFFKQERLDKLKQVASLRTYHFSVVTEYLYDTGNINAIMRTSENFGIQPFHVIEAVNTHISQRTTKGAEKWLDQHRWASNVECIDYLKKRGYKIVATTFSEKSKNFTKLSYDAPSAFIFGSEGFGISEYVDQIADEHVIIPTVGFSQSFNVSVAASIILGKLMLDPKYQKYLTPKEQDRLHVEFVLRDFLATKGGKKMLPRLFSVNTL
ncbi:MAG: RNA methyltransferase [Bdellovibrio sp.]